MAEGSKNSKSETLDSDGRGEKLELGDAEDIKVS